MRFFKLIPTLLVSLVPSLTTVFAQLPYNPAPFAIVGKITAATINDASDILSGGTITVAGYDIIIPKNLLVNLPSVTAVSWGEMFKADGTINLPLWPEVSWEASVTANIFGQQHIAGIIYIFQELGHTAQGFINSIDYATGVMVIGGHPNVPDSGERVVINDPVGRFGLTHPNWPLWTADTENPSVHATTGFPMCVPRVNPATADDPLCPRRNRPQDGNGNPRTTFTFPAPPVSATQPNPNIMAPLRIGDFVTYSATEVPDESGTGRIWAAYALEANLGIFTASGTKPAYINIAVNLFGMFGNLGGEFADTRVEGFSTDPTATVQVFAIDVDPCTGAKTERSWGAAAASANNPVGRWRFRPDGVNFNPLPREIVARSAAGTQVTGNDLIAGQFISPWGDPLEGIIWPEQDIIGANMIPFEFDLVPWLSSGSGPWLGGIPGQPQSTTGPIVGTLDPWPGVNDPNIRNCPVINPDVPVSNAGGDFLAARGSTVTLVGTVSNTVSPPGPLTFAWSQVSGAAVTLNNAATANATFTAPSVTSITTLVFRLTVSNSVGSSTDDISVTITPGQPDTVQVIEATWRSGGGSGTLSVSAFTDNPSAALFVSASTPNIPAIGMTSQGGGNFFATLQVRPMPVSVTITSSFGGSASAVVTRA